MYKTLLLSLELELGGIEREEMWLKSFNGVEREGKVKDDFAREEEDAIRFRSVRSKISERLREADLFWKRKEKNTEASRYGFPCD